MRRSALPVLLLPIALSSCDDGGASRANANQTNLAVEEGVVDLNSSIEGDQYSPIPEAADDMAANRSAPPGNASRPSR